MPTKLVWRKGRRSYKRGRTASGKQKWTVFSKPRDKKRRSKRSRKWGFGRGSKHSNDYMHTYDAKDSLI